MWPLLAKIAASLAFQLVTEEFVKQFVVIALRWAAKRSDNEVDDKLVETVAQSWNVKS